MPEIKNTFLKSKMNKDLDSRLVPNGEYRDAKNINISRSEGSDIGAIENILGNTVITNIKSKINTLENSKIFDNASASFIRPPLDGNLSIDVNNLEIIGYHTDDVNQRIFLFLTNYTDTSNDRLSNFATTDYWERVPGPPETWPFYYKGACCYVAQYSIKTRQSKILIAGNFLNFSKTHPIINCNMLDNLLFWTDNRNQPRKINVDLAFNNAWEDVENYVTGSFDIGLDGYQKAPFSTIYAGSPYYNFEDQISVAKFSPYRSIEFLDASGNSGLVDKSSEFLPYHIITNPTSPFPSSSVTNPFVNFSETFDASSLNPDLKVGDYLVIPVQENTTNEVDLEFEITSVGSSSVQLNASPSGIGISIDANTIIQIKRSNTNYDIDYKGDENLLKDKFAKFSYRFKYDDGEYSLMAPFSQAAFVPKQYGSFLFDQENVTSQSGNVNFMENMIDNVKLKINTPHNCNTLNYRYKIDEVQVVIKFSDEQAIRVVRDIDISEITNGTSSNQTYFIEDYLSSKPFKTLPEDELIRVSDRVPIRAMTQEVSGNRLIYGNFIDKHATPDSLNYNLQYTQKGSTTNAITKEFPNHTLKQNRSYQIGVVLLDRYGRSSDIIFSDPSSVSGSSGGSPNMNSTLYAPYSNYGTDSVDYFGNIMQLSPVSTIPGSLNKSGYPGLYSLSNPLGYYTYRIVVKQQEQDYYNVYTPGALAGELIWDTKVEARSNLTAGDVALKINDYLPSFHSENRITLLNLFGDNINKIPRELKEVNGNDTTFDSRVLLYNRINPLHSNVNGSYNTQSVVSKQGEKVVSIEPFRELGSWTTTKGNIYPYQTIETQHNVPQPFYTYFTSEDINNDFSYNFHDIFFNASSNPFIAKIETDFKIGSTPEYTAQIVDEDDSSDMQAAKLKIERAWQNLGVFETAADTSVIDIYYETSTSDLISNYNSTIATGGPHSLKSGTNQLFTDSGSLGFTLAENSTLDTIVIGPFDIRDSTNTVITSSTTVSMQVLDGNSANKTSSFALENIPGTETWQVKSASLFTYLGSSPTTDNFTFTFTVTANGVTEVFTQNNAQLQNITPNLNIPSAGFVRFSQNTGIIDLAFLNSSDSKNIGTLVNGSISNNDKAEIVVEIKQEENSSYVSVPEVFIASPTTGTNGIWTIRIDASNYNPSERDGTYRVFATDANGNGIQVHDDIQIEKL
jgi:hypothetical protein